MSDATSTTPACPPVTSPDLTTFARVDALGLRVDAQQIWPDKAILFCSLLTVDDRCPRCGAGGRVHDQVLRRFTHLPVGRRPTWLSVRVPRFRCDGCGRVWRHSLKTVARPRSKLTRAADWWALCQVVLDHTPIRDDTGPARLLDLVEGRSKKAFKTWLEAQTDQFRARVAIVAMDGFTGFKTAAAEAVPDATAVMDPFHVVALAGDKLNATRQRIQRELTGGSGRADDPLYKARRTLRTGRALLTDKQKARLSALWAIDEAVPLEVTWLTYQDIIDAYRHPDADVGKKLLTSVIDRIKTAVPAGLEELAQLGRTLEKRRDDILAWFDHPGSSNGPTEAINGRLEHLRGIALGFRNLVNYRLRSLLEAGGFRPLIHSLS